MSLLNILINISKILINKLKKLKNNIDIYMRMSIIY